MNLSLRKYFAIILFAFLLLVPSTSVGYGFFDNTNKTENPTIPIGFWDFIGPFEQTAQEINQLFQDAIAGGFNANNVYAPAGNLRNVTLTLNGVEYNGISWNVFGEGSTNPNPSVGYISVINRKLNESNQRVHAILPPPPADPLPYPEYDFFMVNDVDNTVTNNQYSLRLNHKVTMTTTFKISDLSQVSFYASRGLNAPNDANTLADGRSFVVSISTDGTTWIQIGTSTISAPSGTAYAFTHYTYNVPAAQLGQDLFLRIVFNGETLGNGGNRRYSRMVLDELVLVTTP